MKMLINYFNPGQLRLTFKIVSRGVPGVIMEGGVCLENDMHTMKQQSLTDVFITQTSVQLADRRVMLHLNVKPDWKFV